MAKVIRGTQDQMVKALKKALEAYERQFPGSSASLYRQSPAGIRVRIVDERFSGINRAQRHDEVWNYLQEIVGDDVISEVSILLLFPKSELRTSMANMDFERPLPANR